MLLVSERKNSMAKTHISVEVVYAKPDKIIALPIAVPLGTSIAEAIALSGLLTQVPDFIIKEGAVGVYGQKVALDYSLQPGDRIECYRPITADPKEVRQRRAKRKIMQKNKRN